MRVHQSGSECRQSSGFEALFVEQKSYLPGYFANLLIFFRFLFDCEFWCLKNLYITCRRWHQISPSKPFVVTQAVDLIEFSRLLRSWHGLCKGLII
jgi:hypothetical protein